MGSDCHQIVIASSAPDEIIAGMGAWWPQCGASKHTVEPDALRELALGDSDVVVADFATPPPPGRLALDKSALTGHLVLGLFVSLDAPAFHSQLDLSSEVAVWPGEEQERERDRAN